MKRMIAISLLIALAACGKSNPSPAAPEAPSVRLHTVMEMNSAAPEVNSHEGEELRSVLQPMYNYYGVLPHTFLTVGVPESADEQMQAIYPRIKLLSDGSYIMFYHGGRLGSRIWCTLSSDFKKWSVPVMLFKPYTINGDTRRFVNPDAVVLPGGDILLVCSYRANSGYSNGIDCGLAFRRSSDNGKTWSEPSIVEVGANWEPYLLLLPDGTLHCYYTDATPQTKNSGTSLIVSKDGGATWSAKKRVSRLYKYDYWTSDKDKKQYNGEKIYTDQMPCFRVLNDGKTIVGWLEDRIEEPAPSDCSTDSYKSKYDMSLVYNDGLEWTDLGESTAGPERRLTRVMAGAAGYISVFPSGETVLSCGKESLMRLRMCNSSVTKFYGNSWEDMSNWLTPFDGTGYWGATEVVGPAMLAAAIHCEDGMQTGLMYLNHRIDAAHQSVTVDGDSAEWTSDKAFFIGSKKGDELLLRAASDVQNLYLAADMLEAAKGATVTVLLCKEGSKAITKVVMDRKGLVKASDGSVSVASSPATASDGSNGFVSEVSVPLSLLGAAEGDRICIYAMTERSGRTTFSFSNANNSSTWQIIRL